MRAFARFVLLAGVIASIVMSSVGASARPQWSGQTQIGVVGLGEEGKAWQRTRLDLGLKLEALYLRESPRDFGIGPYLEVRTASFRYGEYGGGVVALLPVAMTFPIWLGGGAFARRDEGQWAPGYNAFLAWGGRNYNYSSSYAMVFGLVLDTRVHRGDTPGVDIVLAATIDLEALALPWIYLTSRAIH
jgi:hypothetical protein